MVKQKIDNILNEAAPKRPTTLDGYVSLSCEVSINPVRWQQYLNFIRKLLTDYDVNIENNFRQIIHDVKSKVTFTGPDRIKAFGTFSKTCKESNVLVRNCKGKVR